MKFQFLKRNIYFLSSGGRNGSWLLRNRIWFPSDENNDQPVVHHLIARSVQKALSLIFDGKTLKMEEIQLTGR